MIKQKGDIMKIDRSIINEIKITDNILFTSVFENVPIIKKFIEVILGLHIVDIKLNQREKVMDSVGKSRGVRFDVYVEDTDNKIYDIEIQTSDEKDLLKRLRYYQGRLDINHLNKGENFNDLKTTYIIFICTFNYFKSLGLNDIIYKIEPTLISQSNQQYILNDDSHKIVVNTKGDLTKINNIDLKSFIELLEDGYKPKTKSELTNMIMKETKLLKENEEWSGKYMEVMDRILQQGIQQGVKNTVIEMLKNKVDEHTILLCSKLTQEQLEEIKKEL